MVQKIYCYCLKKRELKKKSIYTLSHTHTLKTRTNKKLNQQNGNEKIKTIILLVAVLFFFRLCFPNTKCECFMNFPYVRQKKTKKIKINGAAICQHTLCIKYLKRDGKMGKNALCWRWSDQKKEKEKRVKLFYKSFVLGEYICMYGFDVLIAMKNKSTRSQPEHFNSFSATIYSSFTHSSSGLLVP